MRPGQGHEVRPARCEYSIYPIPGGDVTDSNGRYIYLQTDFL